VQQKEMFNLWAHDNSCIDSMNIQEKTRLAIHTGNPHWMVSILKDNPQNNVYLLVTEIIKADRPTAIEQLRSFLTEKGN
jgi:hypothetical protein